MPGPERAIPRKRRTHDSHERLLEAGLDQLEEQGWDGFTVSAVASRAGVSVGTLYNRFGDKQALFLALYDRFNARLASGARPSRTGVARENDTLDALLGQLISDLATTFRRHERLLQVFGHQAIVDPELGARVSSHTLILGREFTDALLAHRIRFERPNPRLAAEMTFRMVFDVLSQRMLLGHRFASELGVPWDQLVEELTVACARYLTGSERGSG